MKNGLIRKYLVVCFCAVVMSIVALGIVLLFCASQYFKMENYERLQRNAVQAATVTVSDYENNGRAFVDQRFLGTAYSILSYSIDAEFFLAGLDGEMLLCQHSEACGHSSFQIPKAAIDEITATGLYEKTGTLGGLYTDVRHIVGVPVALSDGDVIGVLFVTSSAGEMMEFLSNILRMFLFGAAAVLLVAYVALYFVASRMAQPVNDILEAMQSFSKGDFSVRVPVSGHDEIGQLARSVNSLASSVSALEGSRRTFIANVSHELRTPMTTISGFVDGILDGTIPEEKRDQYLKVVSVEVKRLSRLVRSMMDTARIEAGELQLNPTIFDISENIRTTIFTFEKRLDEKRVEIIGLETDKVIVQADADLMHQVVYNLVDNAVKFVDEGGYISVNYHSDEDMTYIAIRNSGAGIASDETPRLFDRFYKSDKSRSLNSSGVGLGLHIVKTIINYHRGDILVRSVLGEYTEFEISLPAIVHGGNENP